MIHKVINSFQVSLAHFKCHSLIDQGMEITVLLSFLNNWTYYVFMHLKLVLKINLFPPKFSNKYCLFALIFNLRNIILNNFAIFVEQNYLIKIFYFYLFIYRKYEFIIVI